MLEHLLGTKILLPSYRRRGITAWIDFITLLAVLSGATILGLVALGIVPAESLDWRIRIIYGFIGLSALWQWARQRLF